MHMTIAGKRARAIARASIVALVATVLMNGFVVRPALASAEQPGRVITSAGHSPHSAVSGEVRTWHQHWDITFSGGVPVGGWADILVQSDGFYRFQGHAHDSGATSYDFGIVWVLTPRSGFEQPLAFGGRGHLAGTFESGSRDFDWNESGNNPALVTLFQTGFTAAGRANTTLDIAGLLSSLGDVISKVTWVVALF
jgi:hypothetical protein